MKGYSHLITLDREFSDSYGTLVSQSKAHEPLPIVVNGLSAGASVAYVCQMALKLSVSRGGLPVIFSQDELTCERIAATLTDLGLRAMTYKPRDFVFNNFTASHDQERERLSVLSAIMGGECDAVVTSAAASVINTIPEDLLAKLSITLSLGVEISPSELCQRLGTLGFVRVDYVEAPGQFANRGGIIDLWRVVGEDALRIEFFGDEIDRIATFDVLSQRTVGVAEEVKLFPASEVVIDEDGRQRLISEIEKLISRTEDGSALTVLKRDKALLEGRATLNDRDRYLGIIYKGKSCLLDYLKAHGDVYAITVGTAENEEGLKKLYARVQSEREAMLSSGTISEKCDGYLADGDAFSTFSASVPTCHVNPFAGVSGGIRAAGLFGFRTRATVKYGGNPTLLYEDLESYKKAGYRVLIQCENQMGVRSLSEDLQDKGIDALTVTEGELNIESLREGSVTVCQGVDEGYELISPRIALLSMARDEGRRIMEERRRRRILKRSGGAGQRIMSHQDLKAGDYVVHASYGIGMFEGIESIRIDGVMRDYITIKYAGTDKLFLPCDRLDMIGKYIGARDGEGEVKLSKMGGTDWHKTRTRAKAAAANIAKKLIELYARRQSTEGFAFPADSEMEEEFAAAFEHIETDSQLQAIEEIKADMCRPVPMNRLLCGDVGFGKTEVALRAAFKAIMGGKQVAILVPTTILALQHYQTATTRMRGYPVTVEMLSRFRTPKEQARIIGDTERGKTDILIGTHKMLSSKVKFRDLGLLIVDEEQRFGVAQKERLKETFFGVDVLTLSATPIPRTLNMAMTGISDMSVLDEAPEDRRPVQTYVMEHDEVLILDACKKELLRGGQVLYLYNNVDTIQFVAGKLADAIPEARVAYAHGQMDREDLEDIWQDLVRGEIDILVCTTIIETGVDLPGANTLIIENADRMGLSQLHQIRGRVGRSHRQAYAYFTYRPGKALSEIATKRLAAIREYAEFGAGFKVALRDLEIRGAGNILGSEQHGYIDSVGYDLYVKLLEEAVAEAKGEVKPEEFHSVIDFKVDAHIPEHYVTSAGGRMEIYKKTALIATPAEADDLYDEILDRYGTPPRTVQRLIGASLCRRICEEARISRAELRSNRINLYTEKPRLEIWSQIYEKYKGRLIITSAKPPISYIIPNGKDPIDALRELLCDYYACIKET